MISAFKRWRNGWHKHLGALIVVALLVLLSVVIGGYIFDWTWAGLGPYISPPHDVHNDFQRAKTFWDWMQLLVIPLVLALGALWFNWQQSRTEREIAVDQQREDILEAYLDRISALMLDYKLRDSHLGSPIREVAHIRTLTVLRKLDPGRKATLLKFLQDSGLIIGESAVLALNGADLTKVSLHKAVLKGANLSNADLSDADLSKTDLSLATMQSTVLAGADLRGSNLNGADLRRADLHGANLIGADLHEANLEEANLHDAKVEDTQLMKSESLKGVSGLDESKHPHSG